ncbi:ATP-binding protein [Paraburkholderia sp. SARCC-3016]|uniref:ATP-binding protein n=1 Tax=Paraburkholderia sp. SARCC-3016 TaxID=3058611 RepID=UPI002806EF99|nr:ATP-binding protein [Paraburkholderia sp. SARCC-3016]MDQ7981717.1 ATP-binding protein [Paraburkholderia sp. SARCC-3016]
MVRDWETFVNHLTIRSKLYLCGAVSLFAILGMALLNILIARESSRSISDLYEQVMVPSNALQEVSDAIRDIELEMEQTRTGERSVPDAQAKLIEHVKRIGGAWAEFRNTQSNYPVTQEELAVTRVIDDQLASSRRLFEELAHAYQQANPNSAITDQLENKLHENRAAFAAPLDRLNDIEQEEARELSRGGAVLSSRVVLVSILAVLLTVPCVGFFLFWVITHLDRNIDAINRALAEVAGGELDVRIKATSQDEIGRMVDSLNRTLQIIKAGRESLELLRRRYEMILNALDEGVFGEDTEGRIVFVNPAMEKMLGWSMAELMGCRSRDLFEVAERVSDSAQQSVRTIHDGRDVTQRQRFRRKDGTSFPVEYTRTLVQDADSPLVAVVAFQDISERKRSQDELMQRYRELQELNRTLEQTQGQLLQSEKMASLGQLAAGVAHEINNPVGFIKSNLGSLSTQVAGLLQVIHAYECAEPLLCGEPSILEQIAAARDAADLQYVQDDIGTLIRETAEGVSRVQAIVRDLKEFSHRNDTDPQLADLHKGLDSTLNIVWNELKYKADVVKEYGELPQVECVATQLNQVFMNLLVNAAQAIESRGTITLRTGTADGNVWIEIADTGKGISPDHLPRIFDPFFTTKPVGQGTGLGLSLAYGIVARHGGTIDVRSEVSKGTTFRVSLPVSRSATRHAETAGADV